jgi:DNA-binding Lrp family transcriptional regulator
LPFGNERVDFLAQMIGVNRNSVSAIVRVLQARGIIKYAKVNVEITDRGALKASLLRELSGGQCAVQQTAIPEPGSDRYRSPALFGMRVASSEQHGIQDG